MNISELKLALRDCLETNTPAMVWGPPGIGKTEGISQLAEELSYIFIDVRLSQMDAVDMRGIPFKDPETNRTMWAIPSIWPDEMDHDTKYLIFFDEINHSSSATLSAAFQAIQERRIGEYNFPDNVRLFAASNEEKDGGASAKKMPPPLNNRFSHYYARSSHEDWVKWAVSAGIDPVVTGFIRFSPNSLNEFIAHSNTKEEQQRAAKARSSHAFATPRSWAAVNRFLNLCTDDNTGKIDMDRLRPHILGTVGETAATLFNGYLKYHRDMPDLDKVIANPMNFDVPESAGMQYAMCAGLAAKATTKNFANVLKFVTRMTKEFQAMVVKDAINRNLELLVHPSCIEWQEENDDLLKS